MQINFTLRVLDHLVLFVFVLMLIPDFVEECLKGTEHLGHIGWIHVRIEWALWIHVEATANKGQQQGQLKGHVLVL